MTHRILFNFPSSSIGLSPFLPCVSHSTEFRESPVPSSPALPPTLSTAGAPLLGGEGASPHDRTGICDLCMSACCLACFTLPSRPSALQGQELHLVPITLCRA